MISSAIALFGILALFSMNQEMIPEISSPEAFVVTIYPGMSSAQIEKKVTEKLEESLEILSDLKYMRSESMESVSVIHLGFKDSVNIYNKVPEIREKITLARPQLPADLPNEPVIVPAEGRSQVPVYSVKLISEIDRDRLQQRISEHIIPRMRAGEGVSSIMMQGGREQVVEVKLKINRMAAKGISALDIYGLFQYFNVSLPGGTTRFRDKSMTIRTQGRFSSLKEIEQLVVGYKDESRIYLKDVAEVKLGYKPPDYMIQSDGKDVYVLDVFKKGDGNTVDIIRYLKRVQQEEIKALSGQIEFETISDQSKSTRMSILTVVSSGGMGILFAVLVIFLFLRNWRSTLIIACSLPMTILITALGMFLTGKTLNILTLSGLTVAIGMIVDCSIVVLENIHNRFSELKVSSDAAVAGSAEVGGAVLASTTTSVSVFLPLAFLTGIIGIVMKDLSVTIVIALIASALVSVILIPFLASKLLKEERKLTRIPGALALDRLMERFLVALDSSYRKTLESSLKRRYLILGGSVVILLGSVATVLLMGVSFIAPTDTGEMEIHITSPQSYSLEQTAQKCQEIDRFLKERYPEVDSTVFYSGFSGVASRYPQKYRAIGRIKLVPYRKRSRDSQELIRELQRELSGSITDVDITVLNGGFDSLIALATGGQGFKVKISGPELEEVIRVGRSVRALVESDVDAYKAGLDVELDSRELVTNLALDYMANTGVTPREAGVVARIFFYGLDAGEYFDQKRQFQIFLTSDLAGTEIDSDTINRISLVSGQTGKLVPFSSFSDMELQPSMPVIRRDEQIPAVEVTGYLRTTDVMGISMRLKRQLSSLNLPPGIEVKIGGVSDLVGSSITKMGLVLLIALFLVYTVMVIQFEEFTQPLIIMASIPFCFIGVVLGLLLFGSDINLFAMLGIVALAGIVVNNAIVMVDYFNLLRRRHPDWTLKKVVLEGAVSRLQPILMTTLTTLFGVLPMCFAKGNGSALYAPLGQAIAGGLLTSSLISLILIPILYHGLESE